MGLDKAACRRPLKDPERPECQARVWGRSGLREGVCPCAAGPREEGRPHSSGPRAGHTCRERVSGARKALHFIRRQLITLPTKVRLVKATVFPVVMYGCESWAIKKAEHQRIDGFKLRCWRRLFRVPWTARRSNQSSLKEINPEYSLEGLMLKLKLQYSGHLMQRANSVEKTLRWGKIQGKGRRGKQRMRWLDGITDSMDMSFEQTRK